VRGDPVTGKELDMKHLGRHHSVETQRESESLKIGIVFRSPHSIIDGLIQARHCANNGGMHGYSNYAYHFAKTALYLLMELEKRDPDLLKDIMDSAATGSDTRVDAYIRNLSEE
jgi:hypothetical protein